MKEFFRTERLAAAGGGLEALLAKSGRGTENPALRGDLVVRRQVNMGEVTWAIKNPETGKIYSFEDDSWELIRLFDGSRTREGIVEAWNEAFPQSPVGLQTVLDFEEELGKLELLSREGAARNLFLVQKIKTARQRAAAEKAEGFNPFFIMFKVVDPDRFLNRTVRYVRWIWSPPTVAVAAVCFALTAGVFADHLGTIWDQTLALYAFLRKPLLDLIQFFCILSLIGAIHEFAHAYALKIYGGDVHDVGFALFYFTPAFYCDTSDSLLLESRWERLYVSMAGVYVEIWICAFATFLWVVCYPDTLLHDLAYKTMLFTGVSTLFFNNNPMVKSDGYFAMTQLLETPELREGSFAWIGAWLQRKVLRLPVEVPFLPRRKRRIYVVYGTLALAYTGMVMVLVGYFFDHVYTRLAPDFATVLLVVTLYFVFRKRAQAFLRVGRLVYLDKKELIMSPRVSRPLFLLAAGLFVVLALPLFRKSLLSPVELRPQVRVSVVAPEAGRVVEVAVTEGERVEAGRPLLTLSNPAVESRVAQLAAERDRLRGEAGRRRERGDGAGAFSAESSLAAVEQELAGEEARGARLVVRSPSPGTVLTHRPADLLGRSVAQGAPLAELGDCRTMAAEIPFTERLLTDLAPGQKVSLQLSAWPHRAFHGTIASISPAVASSLPSAPVRGELALLPPQMPGKFVAVATFDNRDGRLLPGMSGVAKVYTKRSSYVVRAWEVGWNWLRTIVW